MEYEGNLSIGWAIESITPDNPVHISGMGYARVIESFISITKKNLRNVFSELCIIFGRHNFITE